MRRRTGAWDDAVEQGLMGQYIDLFRRAFV